FILTRDERDAGIGEPDQDGIEKNGQQDAIGDDRAIAQRRADFPKIENSNVFPVQDQSSFDAFRFRRTRMTATRTNAATPAMMRIIFVLSGAPSGAAWNSQRANVIIKAT